MERNILQNRFSFSLPAGGPSWYDLERSLAVFASRLLFDLDVRVQGVMPLGAKVLASNHPTTIDPVLMLALVTEPVSILISETLFKVSGLGAALERGEHIRVVHAAGRGALEAGIGRLREGRSVGIYPEGALSPAQGGLAPLHSGAARLALRTGTPIVPLGVAVEREKIRRLRSVVDGKEEHGAWYLGGRYAVTLGEAFWPQGDPGDRELTRQVTVELGRRIGRLAAESERRLAERG